ncbi:MAG: hypothetical protein Q8L27_03010 [archaeon]|nr:hypothetical protein [archaeon]
MSWNCDICKKNKVPDEGEGFRFFIEHNVLSVFDVRNKDKERIDMWGTCKRQIRICPKCLKTNFKTIKI